MGSVADLLTQKLTKQLTDAGIVVWYDPERFYLSLAANLTLPKAVIKCYSDSFFGHGLETENRTFTN
jgi:hypothetical protein